MKDGLNITVHVKLRYLVLYVIVIVGCVLGLAFWYSRATVEVRQTIAYGSSLLGATIAICTLLYTAQNIRRANEEKKSTASAKFFGAVE